ncbi:MAG: response regulator transcription factor [Actinobacteria bacterium]|nr:response regulator transcription factor [Actinomycetota bacterium]MCG2806795.1 response regulator transcription factor [Coriobacteriia bacterium]MDP2233076.1 response regulator transcription factor [Actinomycetota bacterium]
MSEVNILIVEDDVTIARFVELELGHAGYQVRKAADGWAALEEIREQEPDLLILDVMLPVIDGLEVARRLRKESKGFPILMLTARADTQDVVSGFDAGADDYLRKPFEIPELLSRVRALLKRTEHERSAPSHSASGVEVDPNSRRALVGGEPIDLTAKEFDLLYYLITNSGRVISRDEILKAVWGGQHATDSNVIEVFVCHLRNKIGDKDNTTIQTIRGVGYFFAKG